MVWHEMSAFRLVLLLVGALVLAPSTRANASVADEAVAVVELYYAMQGQSDVDDETIDSGFVTALELLAAGYDPQALSDLVVQVHREIPGAATQPFEVIFPPFVRAMGGRPSHTATASTAQPPSRPPRATRTNPAPIAPRNTTLTSPTQPLVPTGAASLRTKVQAGVIVGFAFDAIGFGLFVASPVTLGQGGIALMGVLAVVGGTLATTGSIIGTAAMSTRHAAYVRAGYRPSRKQLGASWTLTGISIGLGIASWVIPLIGGVIAAGTVIILELVNMMSVRKKWQQDLIFSEAASVRGLQLEPMVSLLPLSPHDPPVLTVSVAF